MKSVLSVLVGFAVMSMAGCGLLDDECASDAGEIRVASADGDFYIDKYEASRANATSAEHHRPDSFARTATTGSLPR